VARTTGERLRPFQANATGCISLEVEPANVRQDFLISMTCSEFAEAAGLVVDAEFEAVAGSASTKSKTKSSEYSPARLFAACSRSRPWFSADMN
jgi:hypothetical protein